MTFYSSENSLKTFTADYVRETTKGGSVRSYEIWDKTANQAWDSFTGQTLNSARPQGFPLQGGTRLQYYPRSSSVSGHFPTIAHQKASGKAFWKLRFLNR